MRHSVIFCGTPQFAIPSLQALINDDTFDVIAVITQPDRPVGRRQEITSPPVKALAETQKIPVYQPENINTFLPQEIEKKSIDRPDFIVVVAYGKILKQEVLDLPKIAPINVHASLLPRWRGASPIENAILAGDKETGITIQIMSAGLDEGPILATKAMSLKPQDTSPLLREKLSKIGAELLVETLKKTLQPREQPTEGVTVCKKLTKEDGNVNPQKMTAEEIDRRVRAFQPWPGTRVVIEGQDVKLIETSLEEVTGSIPLLCAQSTTLHLIIVQPAGKKPMKAIDWKRGTR